jgi:hypothetical protein
MRNLEVERYGIRTHVTSLEGWYANHYTNHPNYMFVKLLDLYSRELNNPIFFF